MACQLDPTSQLNNVWLCQYAMERFRRDGESKAHGMIWTILLNIYVVIPLCSQWIGNAYLAVILVHLGRASCSSSLIIRRMSGSKGNSVILFTIHSRSLGQCLLFWLCYSG